MSILLYVAGAILVVIGAVLIGFGIPINEFSFGNTLIVAGTVTAVGGVIVLSLGVVVRALQHLAEAYGRAGARVPKSGDGKPADGKFADSRSADAEPPVLQPQAPVLQPRPAPPAAPTRVPFPPKPKTQPRPEASFREPFEPAPPEPRSDRGPPPFMMTTPTTPVEEVFGAPALPNPEAATAFDRDEAFDRPASAPLRDFDRPPPPFFARDTADDEAEQVRSPFAPPRRPGPPPAPTAAPPEKLDRTYFDSMWVDEPRPSEPASAGMEQRAPAERPEPHEEAEARAEPIERDAQEEASIEEPRSVPILKSGVVDGMGYTLYVDGSIEAELPQGVLRFASINELRAHLEKTS